MTEHEHDLDEDGPDDEKPQGVVPWREVLPPLIAFAVEGQGQDSARIALILALILTLRMLD